MVNISSVARQPGGPKNFVGGGYAWRHEADNGFIHSASQIEHASRAGEDRVGIGQHPEESVGSFNPSFQRGSC